MLSPIILIALLFAPTVPSEPKPQNLQLIVPSGVVSIISSSGRDNSVTSSIIPIVKGFLGLSFFMLLNTASICDGLVSFEPSPYLPPIITGTLEGTLVCSDPFVVMFKALIFPYP